MDSLSDWAFLIGLMKLRCIDDFIELSALLVREDRLIEVDLLCAGLWFGLLWSLDIK